MLAIALLGFVAVFFIALIKRYSQIDSSLEDNVDFNPFKIV